MNAWKMVGIAVYFCSVGLSQCMLTVKVVSDNMLPFADVSVTASSTDEAISPVALLTLRSDVDGYARFCDLPAGLYEVTIGSPSCGQQVHRYRTADLFSRTSFVVHYKPCAHSMFSSVCTVIVRPPIDSSDRAYVKPKVMINSTIVPKGLRPDEFGRVVFSMRKGDSAIVSIGSETRRFVCEKLAFDEWNARPVPWSQITNQ